MRLAFAFAVLALATAASADDRGRYLVENVAGCFGCHATVDWARTSLPTKGTEGAGGWIADDSVPFRIYAPNITPDRESGAGSWSDEDFRRALRQGIGHDGRTLHPTMPYEFFRSLADDDLAAILRYVRSVPARRHTVPRMAIPEEIRKTLVPLPPPDGPMRRPPAEDLVATGRYLVTMAQCEACHTPRDEKGIPRAGLTFGGGVPIEGPWGTPRSANLTPHPSGIAHYDTAVFQRTMHTGRVNGVRPLSTIMPWEFFGRMTDRDLAAVFAYLRTLAPVRHNVSNTDPPTRCRVCGNEHGRGDTN